MRQNVDLLSDNKDIRPTVVLPVAEVIDRLKKCRRDGWDEVDYHLAEYIQELTKLLDNGKSTEQRASASGAT